MYEYYLFSIACTSLHAKKKKVGDHSQRGRVNYKNMAKKREKKKLGTRYSEWLATCLTIVWLRQTRINKPKNLSCAVCKCTIDVHLYICTLNNISSTNDLQQPWVHQVHLHFISIHIFLQCIALRSAHTHSHTQLIQYIWVYFSRWDNSHKLYAQLWIYCTNACAYKRALQY